LKTSARVIDIAGGTFNAARDTFTGAVISIPIAWPSAVKSMVKPGSTLRVRALF